LGVTLLASAARAANAHTTTAHVATVVRRRPSPRRPSSLLPSFPVILRNLATAPFFDRSFVRSIQPAQHENENESTPRRAFDFTPGARSLAATTSALED
jgi:hypothetical protein